MFFRISHQSFKYTAPLSFMTGIRPILSKKKRSTTFAQCLALWGTYPRQHMPSFMLKIMTHYI